jgi:hypothetical protein
MMDVTRRTFVGSSLAAIAASSVSAYALPNLALPPALIDPKRQAAIDAIKGQFTKYMEYMIRDTLGINPNLIPHTGAAKDEIVRVYKFGEQVCHAMVDQRPDDFIDRTMSGPTALVLWPANAEAQPDGEFDMITICASGRSYKWETNSIDGWSPEVVAQQLFEELDKEHRRVVQYHANGGIMAHAQYPWSNHCKHFETMNRPAPQRMMYMPACPVRAIDPGSFTPKVGFKIRYGYTFGNTRMWRHNEDEKLEIRRERAYLAKLRAEGVSWA